MSAFSSKTCGNYQYYYYYYTRFKLLKPLNSRGNQQEHFSIIFINYQNTLSAFESKTGGNHVNYFQMEKIRLHPAFIYTVSFIPCPQFIAPNPHDNISFSGLQYYECFQHLQQLHCIKGYLRYVPPIPGYKFSKRCKGILRECYVRICLEFQHIR